MSRTLNHQQHLKTMEMRETKNKCLNYKRALENMTRKYDTVQEILEVNVRL
jgi:hypothetical protein